MAINRRKALAVIGGGTIIAAGTVSGAFLATRTPHKALAPWKLAGTYKEPRRRALSFAILAPNPHNRQPWLVDLSKDNEITLFVDTEKLLPHTDPFNRQITIGLGCFLELLIMAAAEDGNQALIEAFPEGFDNNHLDERPVAKVTFSKNNSVTKDPLFAHVLLRRSMKEPFNLDRPVGDNVLSKLDGAMQNGMQIGTTNKTNKIAELRSLTHKAMAVELATPRTYKESVDLFRIGKTEVNANPDGIDFTGPLFDTLAIFGLFDRKTALDTTSSVYQQGIDAVMANIDTAMGYVWLNSDTNTRLDQINAGRDWLRLNLTTTAIGLDIHPISQALQEYDEMSEHFSKLHNMLGAQGKTVQMLGRLGYAENIPPSPRWPVTAKILKA